MALKSSTGQEYKSFLCIYAFWYDKIEMKPGV